MPIKVVCKCGKTLAAPDQAAGKSIRCPGCQTAIQVPGAAAKAGPPANAAAAPKPKATGPAQPAARPAAPVAKARPQPAPSPNDLSDLFDQEGFVADTRARCPACSAVVKAGATICTSCGLNLQTGERIHGLAVKPSSGGGGHGHGHGHGGGGGDAALAHASEMMERDKRMEDKLNVGGGLPWWVLLIMLMLILGGCSAAAIVVVAIFTEDPTKLPGGMGQLVALPKLSLAGVIFTIAFGFPNAIGRLTAIVCGFKESVTHGLMVMFIPFYDFYFCFKRWKQYSGVFYMLLFTLLGILTGVIMIAVGNARA